MRIGVPRENTPGETRVALTPNEVAALTTQGHDVVLERGAGDRAGHPDEEYVSAGARTGSRAEAYDRDVVLTVWMTGPAGAGPDAADLAPLRQGTVLIGLANPLSRPEPVRRLADRGVTAFSLDLLPRITRAQAMDVLSSQSSVAGYRAALLGAVHTNRILPMMTTAAGTLPPARVLVLGAGVAGLQAIATARRLGAIVYAYDVRAATKTQIESVGGIFVDVSLDTAAAEGAGGYAEALSEDFYARQREVLAGEVSAADIVIATAQVPGRPAPVLVTKDMIPAMRPGSVIVDAAAAQGGNCEVSRPDETVETHGVTVLAPTNLPAGAAAHASRLYARNIANFARHAIGADGPDVTGDDPIIQQTLLTWNGEIVHSQVRELLDLPPLTAAPTGRPSS
jgi:H+-translocating NAD(P) transhydrogenase subunit alpha